MLQSMLMSYNSRTLSHEQYIPYFLKNMDKFSTYISYYTIPQNNYFMWLEITILWKCLILNEMLVWLLHGWLLTASTTTLVQCKQ